MSPTGRTHSSLPRQVLNILSSHIAPYLLRIQPSTRGCEHLIHRWRWGRRRGSSTRTHTGFGPRSESIHRAPFPEWKKETRRDKIQNHSVQLWISDKGPLTGLLLCTWFHQTHVCLDNTFPLKRSSYSWPTQPTIHNISNSHLKAINGITGVSPWMNWCSIIGDDVIGNDVMAFPVKGSFYNEIHMLRQHLATTSQRQSQTMYATMERCLWFQSISNRDLHPLFHSKTSSKCGIYNIWL